jgi:serine/threonine protein kinase
MGTPSYMSPEQVSGKKVDGRADLWSLGVMLYELSTGEKPFKGGDAIGTLLFQIANDTPVPPNQYRQDLPSDVIAIIDKCLQKNPDDRYARGREIAGDLRRALERLKTGAPAPLTTVAVAAVASSAERTIILDNAAQPTGTKQPEQQEDKTVRIEPGGQK